MIDDWLDAFIDYVLPATIILCVALIVGIVVIEVRNDMKQIPDGAIVTGKDFTPAHTTTTFIMAGEVLVPTTQFYPDSYQVEFTWANNSAWRYVDKSKYDAIEMGMNYSSFRVVVE